MFYQSSKIAKMAYANFFKVKDLFLLFGLHLQQAKKSLYTVITVNVRAQKSAKFVGNPCRGYFFSLTYIVG